MTFQSSFDDKSLHIDADLVNSHLTDDQINSLQSDVENAVEILHSGSGAGSDFLGWLDHHPPLAEDHSRAVVHGVVKKGPCHDQTIEQGKGQAEGRPIGGIEQPAGRRAVEINRVVNPAVDHGNHERLSLLDKPDVADEGLVDYRMVGLDVVVGPVG